MSYTMDVANAVQEPWSVLQIHYRESGSGAVAQYTADNCDTRRGRYNSARIKAVRGGMNTLELMWGDARRIDLVRLATMRLDLPRDITMRFATGKLGLRRDDVMQIDLRRSLFLFFADAKGNNFMAWLESYNPYPPILYSPIYKQAPIQIWPILLWHGERKKSKAWNKSKATWNI